MKTLNELSKKTIQAYRDKAKDTESYYNRKSLEHGRDYRSAHNVLQGMRGNHLGYTEREKDEARQAKSHAAAEADRYDKKAVKRREGIKRATERLTREEIEQMNEGYARPGNKHWADAVQRAKKERLAKKNPDILWDTHQNVAGKHLAQLCRDAGHKPTPSMLKYEKKAKQVAEDFGQLDELSKKTMLSYYEKAKSRLPRLKKKAENAARNHSDYKHELTGARKSIAHSKEMAGLTKSDRTRRKAMKYADEMQARLPEYRKDLQDARKEHNKARHRVEKRAEGIKRASERLTKEEAGQLDELSRATKTSYLMKAMRDVEKKRGEANKLTSMGRNARKNAWAHHDAADNAENEKTGSVYGNLAKANKYRRIGDVYKSDNDRYMDKQQRLSKQIPKRIQGVHRAARALAKEEAMNSLTEMATYVDSYDFLEEGLKGDKAIKLSQNTPESLRADLKRLQAIEHPTFAQKSLMKRLQAHLSRINEESEQLDELSKATILSYRDKAIKSAREFKSKRGSWNSTARIRQTHAKQQSNAVDRMTKPMPKRSARDSGHAYEKDYSGAAMDLRRAVRDYTYGSPHSKKYPKDRAKHLAKLKKNIADNNKKHAAAVERAAVYDAKYNKRAEGIKRAEARLTKEETFNEANQEKLDQLRNIVNMSKPTMERGKNMLRHAPNFKQQGGEKSLKNMERGYRSQIKRDYKKAMEEDYNELNEIEHPKSPKWDPLVTVYEKGSVTGHMWLSTANKLHRTNISAADVRRKKNVTSGNVRFELSPHHKEEYDPTSLGESGLSDWNSFRKGENPRDNSKCPGCGATLKGDKYKGKSTCGKCGWVQGDRVSKRRGVKEEVSLVDAAVAAMDSGRDLNTARLDEITK